MQVTMPPNEELVLTEVLRSQLVGVWVSNRLMVRDGIDQPPTAPLAVIVRSDGGEQVSPASFVRRIGIRVFGPDGDDNHLSTSELARRVVAVLQGAWRFDPSIAQIRGIFGPYRVQPTVGRPEMYLTAELVLVGETTTV